jgi:hypothetical protein
MEIAAPLLFAILFIVFGLTRRESGGCSGCRREGACHRGAGCPKEG